MVGRHAFAWTVVAAATGVALGACGGSPAASPPVAVTQDAAQTTAASVCGGAPTVSATAVGSVTVRPNTLLVDLGVRAKAATAQAALAADDAHAAKLIRILRAAGIPAVDLQTTNLSIGPDYGRKGVTGYVVTNVVSVTDTRIASAGRILDDAANAVGNGIQFDNLQFVLTGDTSPTIAARARAVRLAEGRARAMATAAGGTLGPLCSISDDSSAGYLAGNSGYALSAGASGSAAAAPTPVESGNQAVTAQVTVVYEVGNNG